MNEVKVQQVVRIEKKLGRLELLNWLNETLRTDYAKVQDCADGIAYCQLIDTLAPGLVPLHKLSFTARTLDDNMKNLRILEEAMYKLGVRKDIDVPGLAKGKFQENNEFLQWLHALLQKNSYVPPDAYKAFERRWAAQERQKKGAGGVGSRSKGRQHQLNNNLVPNEYEWHEGPVRDAPPQAKPPILNGVKPARPSVDTAKRQSSNAAESTGLDPPRRPRGPVGETPSLAAPSRTRPDRASADGPVLMESRTAARGSDDWKGLDERVSWIGGTLGRGKEAWLADPLFAELEDLQFEGGNSLRDARGSEIDAREASRNAKGDARNKREDLGGERLSGIESHRTSELDRGARASSEQESGSERMSDAVGGSRRPSGTGGESRRDSEQKGGKIKSSAQERGSIASGGGGVAQTRRQQAELESLIAYLESELVSRLRAFADLKKEVKLVDEERRFYHEKLRRLEKLCEHAHSVDAVTEMVLHVVDILSNEDDCPAIKDVLTRT